MKILMVNKFLHPNGGSETYIFQLGKYLESQGHEVQYFGMEHEGRCVGNSMNSYTSNMEFHQGKILTKLSYPLKTIYSQEARTKLRMVLDDFMPDVVHLNNFNYQLTPSILLETVRWRSGLERKILSSNVKNVAEENKKRRTVRIIYTAHDYQLICPNHMCHNPNTHENCEKCLGGAGKFIHCFRGKCIHGSRLKSAVGMAEAMFWNWSGVYHYIDKIICCSEFMKSMLDRNPLFKDKTIAVHNFVDQCSKRRKSSDKKDYVLYFGRYSEEKGFDMVLKAAAELPEVRFVFAGKGSIKIADLPNVTDIGFLSGDALDQLISNARFVLVPSRWYEPFGLTVREAQICGTPVIGARVGGIQELIQDGKNGELFKCGDGEELKAKIKRLWDNDKLAEKYGRGCLETEHMGIKEYYTELMAVYNGK
ncbi:MAG: glycosyltransferase family 4 protein [Lachnospiraceae bacterium]|nr:glycosyltransferase family 4 protein [Lachnospiraceae bacterium]